MSEQLDAAAATLQEHLHAADLDGSIKFEVTGLGALRVEDGKVTKDDSEADCTISADAETFEAMVTGELDPTAAFMSGKLQVDGDMSKAMALSQILG